MKLTIGKKIFGAFLVIISGMVLLSGYTYYKIGQINEEYQSTTTINIEKLILAEELSANIVDEAATVRKFNLTGDPAAREEFAAIRKESNDRIDRMEHIFVTESAKKSIVEIKAAKAEYEQLATQAMQAGLANDQQALKTIIQQGTVPYAKVTKQTDELVDMIKEYVKTEQAKIADKATTNQRVLFIINGLIIVLAVAISIKLNSSISTAVGQLVRAVTEIAGGKITRDSIRVQSNDEIADLAAAVNTMKSNMRTMIQQVMDSAELLAASSAQLKDNSGQMAQAGSQVADSINAIASGAEQQLASIDATAAVITQMSAGIQQAAANAAEINERSGEAAETAILGSESVKGAILHMNKIEENVSHSAEVVTQLGMRSKEIGQIIDTISQIASQTNLLALNAAIEAARAGEQGRGFAVVAEEVRKLAEQSQDAAKQIAELIGMIQTDTDRAVAVMNEGPELVSQGADVVHMAGLAFQDINDLVQTVHEQMQQVSDTLQQISTGSQQIVLSVERIDQHSKLAVGKTQAASAATEEQSASSQEIAAASEELSSTAEELKRIVDRFQLS
ncbi:methyl-accepting chemotaxis protein [Propionispora hippei]|uniref:Methyl-accepting chemotaxis protein n=1 Tax=Propionispora hippei DSM 15287 TaxID=1123003 RepID=A0A1M6G5F4_9FIRM|nr:methyl-accepting chemotaxis protein [Propionispora hippei]SHJ05172.1 methyl-accepting chemotaxis protein [Propionispora hippei DSM 15287]